MGDINRIYVAIRTKYLPYSGSGLMHLIINQLGWDRLNVRMINDDRMVGSFSKGACVFYYQDLPMGGLGTINDNLLGIRQLYVRLLTKLDDMWEPSLAFIWGSSEKGPIPLAFESDFSHALSTDPSEGLPSVPVKRVEAGSEEMLITRLLIIITTSDSRTYAGSRSKPRLTVRLEDGTVAFDGYFKWALEDFEPGTAHIYEINTRPFTKADLVEDSITLSLEGRDLWIPGHIWLFGMNSEHPTQMLIITRDYQPGPMSQDPNEDPNEGSIQLSIVE